MPTACITGGRTGTRSSFFAPYVTDTPGISKTTNHPHPSAPAAAQNFSIALTSLRLVRENRLVMFVSNFSRMGLC